MAVAFVTNVSWYAMAFAYLGRMSRGTLWRLLIRDECLVVRYGLLPICDECLVVRYGLCPSVTNVSWHAIGSVHL